jgi:hypothetical protein
MTLREKTCALKSLAVLLLICGTAWAYGADLAGTSGEFVFCDDFDSYTAGEFPAGWYLKHSGYGTNYQVVDSSQSVSPPHSFKMEGRTGYAAVSNHALPETLSLVCLELDIHVTEVTPASWGDNVAFIELVAHPSGHAAAVRFGPSHTGQVIYTSNGVNTRPFDQGVWYHVKICADFSTGNYSAWIDGELLESDILITPSTSTGKIEISAGNSTHTRVWFDNIVVTDESAIPIALDIKPQSCPNPLNTKSQGVLPVAILGTAYYDVYDIDPASLLLEGISPFRWSYEDVATPMDPGGDVCDCNDQGPDGIMDLALKFRTQEVIAALEPVSDGEVRILTLTGMTQESTVIEGQDCVVIIDKDRDKKPKPLGIKGGGILSEFGSYPNPFNAETDIRFGLLEAAEVSLVVYNILGEKVRTLLSAEINEGIHLVHWDGKDAYGCSVASGIYFCCLRTESAARTMKMIVLR